MKKISSLLQRYNIQSDNSNYYFRERKNVTGCKVNLVLPYGLYNGERMALRYVITYVAAMVRMNISGMKMEYSIGANYTRIKLIIFDESLRDIMMAQFFNITTTMTTDNIIDSGVAKTLDELDPEEYEHIVGMDEKIKISNEIYSTNGLTVNLEKLKEYINNFLSTVKEDSWYVFYESVGKIDLFLRTDKPLTLVTPAYNLDKVGHSYIELESMDKCLLYSEVLHSLNTIDYTIKKLNGKYLIFFDENNPEILNMVNYGLANVDQIIEESHIQGLKTCIMANYINIQNNLETNIDYVVDCILTDTEVFENNDEIYNISNLTTEDFRNVLRDLLTKILTALKREDVIEMDKEHGN